jgi:hypothetical protein
MMRPRSVTVPFQAAAAAVALVCLAGMAAAQPVVFTQWTFNNLATGQIVNNPAPSTGRGAAVPLGMTNNYAYSATVPGSTPPRNIVGSFTTCDVTSSNTGSSDPTNSKFWRVRGGFDGTLAGAGVGYALAAPQYTQGAQFEVSTQNFANVVLTFDWFNTNQSVRNMQVQYSTNAGATWNNIATTTPTGTVQVLTAVPNAWTNGLSIDFTGIPAVNDNPNFRVRMVSVYDSTLSPLAYGGASGGRYNNASGNWRFDMVTFRGDALRSVGPAGTGEVNPPAVCSSGGPLTFTVTAQGGAGPVSTGITVAADLSALGLNSTQAFRDDGTNGDLFAGDGIYTYVAAIPDGQTPGPATITATISDAQGRSGTTTIPVTVGNCAANSNSRVVISQIFSSGGNVDLFTGGFAPFDADYVELYNRSATAVSLEGWSVQYASQGSAAGFADTGDRVPLRGSIRPGQRMLVRMSDPVPGFNPLPEPDFAQLPNFGGMGNTGGRVALVRSTTLLGTNYNDASIEDFVGYGSGAISFEGNGPAATASPVLTSALLRKLDGVQDSNQNFNDFVSGAVNPRNRADGGFLAAYPSASLSAVCSGADVTFFSRVVPGAGSTGITVAVDVSSIVGSPATVQLLDNGSNGDAFAGDGIYSATYTVPVTTAQANRTVAFTASDAQGRSDTSTLPISIGNCFNSNAPVVISRVFGGGGNAGSGFTGDFAEIFNRSNAPVNLTGWSLQSARITDADGFNNRICFLSGVINPGEYRLIVTNQVSATGIPLPAADYVPATLFGMESSFGRVVLVASTTLVGNDLSRSDVVDLVGYGSATPSFEGVGPTATLSDILYAARKEGGCQDTNQNAIDFEVLLAAGLNATPRNGSTPAAPCPGGPQCLADIAGGGATGNSPDGTVDGSDFIAFINSFSIGDATVDPLADVAGGGTNGDQPDGTIDGSDFIAFINAFGAGC